MYSFDIKILYTAVPMEESTNICSNALLDIKNLTKFDERELYKIITTGHISV